MKVTISFLHLFLVFVFFTAHPGFAQELVTHITPGFEWEFADQDQQKWYPASVPGCIHTDLFNNKLIENPLLGTNEDSCAWIAEKTWYYRTQPFNFDPELMKDDAVELIFFGLDTYATVYLNDEEILISNNAFRKWTADIKGIIRSANNVIKIKFDSTIPKATALVKDVSALLPGDPIRAVTRKPQYQYGWDWGPKLNTCGITDKVEIVAWSVARITDFYVRQDEVNTEVAKLTVVLNIESRANTKAMVDLRYQALDISVAGIPRSAEISLRPGMNEIELPLEVDYPALWWCNDWGNQHLYGFYSSLLINEVECDVANVRTGLRSLKLVNEKDNDGESFQFELNGQPVFAKGANYIPITYFPGQAIREDYSRLLESCRDAHINMLRVWGGGVYEQDWFYDLCDEYGIMVWQDFMFACAMYPGDQDFLDNVRFEAEYQVCRLRNHPCMALWCGNNESSEGWNRWGWQDGLSAREKDVVWTNYSRLFIEMLPQVVNKHCETSFWETSPKFGRGDSRHRNNGDAHYWGVWHDSEPFEVLEEKIPRFMSEFGFQSFPSELVLLDMTNDEKPVADHPGILQHQKHPRGFSLMQLYLNRWYPGYQPKEFVEYGMFTQKLQAQGVALGIIAHRKAMPWCMGTLFWQLNDVWPAFSWSAIDYLGNSKLLFDQLPYLYDPVLITLEEDDEYFEVYATCDWPKDEISKRLEVKIFDENKILYDTLIDVNIVRGTQLLLKVEKKKFPGKWSLVIAHLIDEKGCVVHKAVSGFPLVCKDCDFERLYKLEYNRTTGCDYYVPGFVRK